MATKTTDPSQTDTTTPIRPGERSIGRQAEINFNPQETSGSFTVDENRRSEDAIQNALRSTEEAGRQRGRARNTPKGNVPSTQTNNPLPPSPFSPADTRDTAQGADSFLRQNNPERQAPTATPSVSINTAPPRPAPSVREQPSTNGRTRRPARNTAPSFVESNSTTAGEAGGEKVMKYTSEGGFLVGKVSPRTQERAFAKTQVTAVEKGSSSVESNSTMAGKTGKKGKNSPITEERKYAKTQVATLGKGPSSVESNSASAGKTGKGPAFPNQLSSKGKASAGKARANRIDLAIRRFAKKTALFLGITSTQKKAPPPPPVKTVQAPIQKHKRTLMELLSGWNNSKIKQAETRGYNPISIRENIRAWKNRTWKQTKQFLGNPITPSTPAREQETRSERPAQTGFRSFFQSQWEPAAETAPSSGYFSWSPSRVSQTFFNRPATSINRRFGGNFAERQLGGVGKSIAKNAAKKAGKQVAQKAAAQAAEAGGKALIMNPPVLAGIAITVAALIFIGIMFFVIIQISGEQDNIINTGGGAPNPGNPGTRIRPPSSVDIPGFTLTKNSESPSKITVSDQINYSISYTAPTGSVKLEDITIYDKLPDNVTFQSASGINTYDASTNTVSWKLSESGNSSPLKLIVIPKSDNITVVNSAYALTPTTIAPPGGTAQSPNACTRPHEGVGYCSYQNLLPYFDNNPQNTLMASLICQGESGSNPFNQNLICPPDYSIGLFMINQLAHCSTAFSDPSACVISNKTLLDACAQRFYDPIENIKYAVQLYKNKGDWSAWVTQSAAARGVLSQCGSI